jgi:hypothetical protein|tara:strand:+ start:3682 stop:4389 length:708 start_codon:yes stop_codon:yes gene_type:complete
MKRFLSLAMIFLSIVSCSKNEKLMHLTGHVDGLKKGTLLLQRIEDTLLVSVDSVMVNGDSNFEFSKEIESPEIYYLYLRLKDGTLIDERIPFFAEPGEISIKTSLKNLAVNARVEGSKNQDALNDYKKLLNRYSSRELDQIESSFNALRVGNDSLVDAIAKQRKSLATSKFLMTVNFAMNHKEYELAPYLMLSEIYNSNTKYLDTVYKALTPKIKDSKYGKSLESFIKSNKTAKN